jgi:hypothetical protein
MVGTLFSLAEAKHSFILHGPLHLIPQKKTLPPATVPLHYTAENNAHLNTLSQSDELNGIQFPARHSSDIYAASYPAYAQALHCSAEQQANAASHARAVGEALSFLT